MAVVGPMESLVALLVGAVLVSSVFRGRVPPLALVLIVLVLSPLAALSLLFVVGTVAGVFALA